MSCWQAVVILEGLGVGRIHALPLPVEDMTVDGGVVGGTKGVVGCGMDDDQAVVLSDVDVVDGVIGVVVEGDAVAGMDYRGVVGVVAAIASFAVVAGGIVGEQAVV